MLLNNGNKMDTLQKKLGMSHRRINSQLLVFQMLYTNI
jgi:hypothetical protein